MLRREGKDPKSAIWLKPSLPKYSNKKDKGPLTYIEELWLYGGRVVNGTLAVYPKDR